MNKTIDYVEYIEANTLRCEVGYRGGGIEISLDNLFNGIGFRMTAYQNYLGGGVLGRICNDYNFNTSKLPTKRAEKLEAITDALNRYFHSLTSHEDDEWESASYEQNQNRPVSAY